MSPSTSLLDEIPKTTACSSALAVARTALLEPTLNHSLRVFFYAKWLGQKETSEWVTDEKLPALFIACVFHDLGTSDQYNGSQRFEVEGADAAKAHAISHGITAEDAHNIWVAIAIHSSPGIAERIDPLSRLVRFAVKSDFSRDYASNLGLIEYVDSVEEQLPRLAVEKVLADAVVNQAAKLPARVDSMTWPSTEKHPSSSWPGILLRAHIENPGYEGVNPAF